MPYEEEIIIKGQSEDEENLPSGVFYAGMSQEKQYQLLNDLHQKLESFNANLAKKDTRSVEDSFRNRSSINPGHQHLLVPFTPAQITAATNNYNIQSKDCLRLSTDASRNITGFNGGFDGKFLYIFNVGSFNIVLVNQSASSSAANRILTHTGGDVTVGANESVMLWYDQTTARWRIKGDAVPLDDLSDVVITSAAQGQVIYYNGTNWVNLAVGTDGQALTTQGAGANPTWANAVIFKHGLTTRDNTAASGEQTIAHGLGVTPKYIRISAMYVVSSTATTEIESVGVYDGTTTSCISFGGTTVGSNVRTGQSSTNIIVIVQTFDGPVQQVAKISTITPVDATNITLTWTKTGTPDAGNIEILWEAWA